MVRGCIYSHFFFYFFLFWSVKIYLKIEGSYSKWVVLPAHLYGVFCRNQAEHKPSVPGDGVCEGRWLCHGTRAGPWQCWPQNLSFLALGFHLQGQAVLSSRIPGCVPGILYIFIYNVYIYNTYINIIYVYNIYIIYMQTLYLDVC